MTRAHVIHLLTKLESGGAQRVAMDLARWSRQEGYPVAFVGADGRLTEEFAAIAPTVVTKRRGVLQTALAAARLARSAPRTAPVVLHAHQRREALAAILAALLARPRRVRRVEHAHTLLPSTGARSLSYRSEHIFAVTPEIATHITDAFGVSPDRLTVVQNAPSRRATAPVHAPTRTRILAVGRVMEQKDPRRFVEAVAALQSRMEVEARWVGEGPLLDESRALAEQVQAAIDFVGYSDDVSTALAESTILLMTSRWEGAPLVILEAMSAGLPVVAPAVGGVATLLAEGRGFTYPADASPTDIADLVESVLANESGRAEAASVAKAWVEEMARPEVAFGPILEIYDTFSSGESISMTDPSVDTVTNGRVVFVLPSLLGGGAEFVAKTWATELAQRGYKPEIALLRYRPNEPELENVPLRKLSALGAGRRREMRALRSLLRELGEQDIIVTLMTRANIQVLALRQPHGPKVVISERNIPRVEPGQGRLHIALRDFMFRRFFPKADLFIAISHPVGSAFYGQAKVSPSKTWVVPNPAIAKLEKREAVHIRPRGDRVQVVVPARLVDAKRPKVAFAVCDELHRRGRDISLVFLGEGELAEYIGSQQRPYEVSAPGRVERWFEMLDDHSVVLLPSAVEGFGNVLLEASAVGVPVVVGSRTYGSADAVIPGVTGYFARGDSVSEYASAVERAARLDTDVPDGWLNEFTAENSTDVLLQALSTLGADAVRADPAGKV